MRMLANDTGEDATDRLGTGYSASRYGSIRVARWLISGAQVRARGGPRP